MTLNEFEAKVKDLYDNHKWLIVLLIIPLLILKFRSVIIDILIGDSKKILADTTKKDDALAAQQQEANTKADQIIQDAKATKEKSDKEEVTDDWFKKK